jgi:hypothetical protein
MNKIDTGAFVQDSRGWTKAALIPQKSGTFAPRASLVPKRSRSTSPHPSKSGSLRKQPFRESRGSKTYEKKIPFRS